MRFWVQCIFRINSKLEKMIEVIEKEIEGLSLSFSHDTYKLYGEILKLNDVKISIINLKVMHEFMLKCLNEEEVAIIKKYSLNKSLEEISKEFFVSKTTIFRKINKSIEKCIKVLHKFCFDKERLEKEYGKIYIIDKTLIKIKHEHNIKKRAALGQSNKAIFINSL